jgi:hypothetical protein
MAKGGRFRLNWTRTGTNSLRFDGRFRITWNKSNGVSMCLTNVIGLLHVRTEAKEALAEGQNETTKWKKNARAQRSTG